MSKLQELRKSKNLSQSELAKITNIKVRTIQMYEQLESPIHSAGLDKLVPLALALNCKISDILEDEQIIKLCQELGI